VGLLDGDDVGTFVGMLDGDDVGLMDGLAHEMERLLETV